jgi:hypothetical protein
MSEFKNVDWAGLARTKGFFISHDPVNNESMAVKNGVAEYLNEKADDIPFPELVEQMLKFYEQPRKPMVEVKIREYDEMTFIIPAISDVRFLEDMRTLNYLQFLEKWEIYKRNPDDVKLYMRED